MAENGCQYAPVTDDPALVQRLRAQRAAHPDSKKLGIFAVEELGIEPPGHVQDGPVPSIIEHWPTGSDGEDGIFVWNIDLFSEADPEDGRDAPDSGDWGYGWRPE